ncbi:MAG: hypothetical protein LBD80_00315 [Tannerella sp.]|jgi:hypothetical protein|nr:hypothetical protein [Tannerella sp.]
MNINFKNERWGLAYVRKTPLPPDQTWREVPFYTYLADRDENKYYKAKHKDRPIDIDAIESYLVISFIFSFIEIKPDETVFIDWEGNYFIGKEDSLELPANRNIIYLDKIQTMKKTVSFIFSQIQIKSANQKKITTHGQLVAV